MRGCVRQVSFEVVGAASSEGCLSSGPCQLGVVSRGEILLDALLFQRDLRVGLLSPGGYRDWQLCTVWRHPLLPSVSGSGLGSLAHCSQPRRLGWAGLES